MGIFDYYDKEVWKQVEYNSVVQEILKKIKTNNNDPVEYKKWLDNQFYLFEKNRNDYSNYLRCCSNLVKILFSTDGFCITSRVKDIFSFRDKIIRKTIIREGEKQNWENYLDPFNKMTDILGIRIVSIFRNESDNIIMNLKKLFEVKNTEDKRTEVSSYRAIHMEVTLKTEIRDILRIGKTSVLLKSNPIIEIQIRDKIEDAWSTITHEIGYKDADQIAKANLDTLGRTVIASVDKEVNNINKAKLLKKEEKIEEKSDKQKGHDAYNKQEFESAISYFSKYLEEVNADDLDVKFNIGNAFLHLNIFEESFIIYNDLLEKYPDNESIKKNYIIALNRVTEIATIKLHDGDLDASLKYYLISIKYTIPLFYNSPLYFIALNNTTVIYNTIGENYKAIECIEKLLEIRPQDSSAWYNKGIPLMNRGANKETAEENDNEKAIEAFTNAIRYAGDREDLKKKSQEYIDMIKKRLENK